MKTKFLAIFLSVLTLTSMLCISANAATETLEKNETYKCTATVSNLGAKAKILNAASSKRSVYGYIEYKSGGKFVTDMTFLAEPGNTAKWHNSATLFLSNKTWQLEINPKGALTTGCTADGTILGRNK